VISFAHPAPARGAFRPIVTNVGSGMRWTCCSRSDERGAMRTAKSRGPGAPTLASSFASDDGEATEANKPGTPGRSRISRKTIARGMPVVPAALLLPACSKCTFLCTQGSRVRPAPGIPCALSFFRGPRTMHHSGGFPSREWSVTSPPLSCPAHAGHPVRRDGHENRDSGDCWIARSSRAMTSEWTAA